MARRCSIATAAKTTRIRAYNHALVAVPGRRSGMKGRWAMGLDISVYGGVDFSKRLEEHDGLAHFWAVHWDERLDGIEPGYYSAAKSDGFYAGSYSGYNAFRDALCRAVHRCSAKEMWARPESERVGPFAELINFSDSEGCIGPKTSAKLARDFAEHATVVLAFLRAENDPYQWFTRLYNDFRRGFEMAAQGGFVAFH